MKKTLRFISGALVAIPAQFAAHGILSMAGLHPFPVIGLAWVHVGAFAVGGCVAGLVGASRWAALPASLLFAAAYLLADSIIDPGISASTVGLILLGICAALLSARLCAPRR